MRLAQLRHQMLLAIGLPACWTQTPAPKPAEPVPVAVEPPPPRRTEPQIAMFDAKSCTVDTIVETVCGRMTGEYCDGTAAKLEISNNAEGLYVTTYEAARASAKDFILDDKASEAFVVRLQALNEKLDGKPACCYSRCTPLVVGQAKPLPSPMPAYHMRQEHCVPAPPKGTTQPDATNPACPQGLQLQGELRPYSTTRNDQCCYASVNRRVIIQKGRPARVGGDPRFADVIDGDAWHAQIGASPRAEAHDQLAAAWPAQVDITAVPADVRERLAAAWLAAARMEHASIAAFSATALRLLALGAPPELLAATQRAALDEISHAQIAFALASAYAGRSVSPGAFEAATRVGTGTLRELAIETFVDGCVGETVAALEAERAADAASDPAIASILRKIAVDEARHAELAWQIVAWCVRIDPTIVDALVVDAPTFDVDDLFDAPTVVGDELAAAPAFDVDLEAYGVLGLRTRARAYDDVIREVVAPCVAALAA